MPTEGSTAFVSLFVSPALQVDPFEGSAVGMPAIEDLPAELLPLGYEQLLHQIDNSWRAGGAHLSRSPSGLWYMRLKVPESIRAAYPRLPKELRRSTKTRHKIHALPISRKMCLDFLIRHRISETSMGQPDQSRQGVVAQIDAAQAVGLLHESAT